jgi:4,5-dihydroxyphthalate decarboxylase
MEGKRVGVPLYAMTAAVFIRGLLQHEYDVDLSKIHWIQGAINSPGAHGKPTVLPLVKPVPIAINNSGKSLNDLLEERLVDAIIGTSLPQAIGRNPDIARLFPNFVELEKDYYKRTGIYPIMHLIAIKKEIYERHPFVASSLYNAFVEAKNVALKKMLSSRALRYMTPWLMRDIDEIREVFNGEPWPYGVEPNRKTLEALMTYLVDQSIIAAPIPVDDLFVPTYS